MKRFIFMLLAAMQLAFSSPMFGQGKSTSSEFKRSTIKDLVEIHESGNFRVQGIFVKTYDNSRLLFAIEDMDYIIPITLVKNDLGAEKRFQSLELQKGDTLIVEGRLAKVNVRLETYKGLEDAVIVEKRGGPQKDIIKDSKVAVRPEIEPSFKGGGTLEFSKWVGSHLKYPKVAKENGIQGRVLVAFTVGADGRIKDVKVVKGVDKSLDEEAVRVVSKSPRWKPGYTGGKPVNVSYSIPVYFNFN